PMWHGAALSEVLEPVTPEVAAAHPIAAAHSIWELVLHITVWADVARERLRGERTGDPTPDENWPSVTDMTPAAWRSAVEQMGQSYRARADHGKQLHHSRLTGQRPRLDLTACKL